MRKWLGWLLTGYLMMVLLSSAVWAAETGTIEGSVVDAKGAPLPGVTVIAESTSMQGTRTATTSPEGRFRFPILPVGSYSITCELMGFAPLKQTSIPVKLGLTTPLEVKMSETAVKEVMVVTGEPVVLIEKDTADLSTSITAESLNSLPSADRSFRDIAKFVPGVSGVRINTVDGKSKGYPSIRGEGQYGNNYLIDGLSVRDPATNTTGTPLNFDAIEEVQVITDGFSPEYGQSLGGTINVITKSGSNIFAGEAAMLYESNLLSGKEKNAEWATNRDFTDLKPYLNFGGPIVRDKLWYFLSYDYYDLVDQYSKQTQDQYTISGADKTDTTNDLFAKLTYGFNSSNTLSVSTTFETGKEDHRGIDELHTNEAQGVMNRDEKRVRANYKSLLTKDTVFELKYGWVDRWTQDKPMTGDMGPAMYSDLSTGVKYNNYDNKDVNTRGRNDFAAQMTQFLDDALGTHEIKGGLGYYITKSGRDLQFTGTAEDLFPNRMFGGAEFLYKNGNPYRYYDYSGASVSNTTDGYTFFAQDKWSPISSINVMGGLRLDTQVVQNNAGKTLMQFKGQDTIAPRLTVAWDVTKDGNNIVKAGAGRFYDVVSTTLAEWGNTANPYAYDYYQWGGPGNQYTDPSGHASNADAHNPNNWGVWHKFDDDGDGTYDRFEFEPGKPAATQDPVGNPATYMNIKAPYKDEFLIEFDRSFGTRYAGKVRFVQSHTRDLIDDVQVEPDVWQIMNFDRKKRDYHSFELEFSGRPTDQANFNLSYVNSTAKGTSPGQFELGGFQSTWGSSNTVGVFGDRPPYQYADYAELYEGLGGLDGDDGWYGYLPYSADHEVKLNTSYMAPYGIILGLGFEWNSGYHWQARGFQEAYGGYMTFPEGRGVRTMPSIYWLDVSVAKRFAVYKQQYVTLRLDLFNITGSDTPVSYWQELNPATFDYNGDGQINYKDAFNKTDNPDFGKVLKRQDPRSARLTLSYTF